MDSKRNRIWGGKKNREFQILVLDWYEQNRRSLPWRSRPTPYRVWVSEVMLQQTQVRTVVPYFDRFMRRFPDIAALAAASEEEVMALWSGLGYYSRARNLHRAARIIALELDGKFPIKLEDIELLPGIGRYTAAAIHSIAFNRAQPVVDGNVRRVITRLHAVTAIESEVFFRRQALAWQHNKRPSDFAQAVMELGALVCKPAAPLCADCPVRSLCRSHKMGIQNRLPLPRSKRALEKVEFVVLVLQSRGEVILTRERAANYVPGEWGLPARIVSTKKTELRETAKALAKEILGDTIPVEGKMMVRHAITRRRIRAHIFYADIGKNRIKLPAHGKVSLVEISRTGRMITSSLFKKALRSALS